jgi:sensor histidine kinase regulating citrate/malate metabolism
LATHHLNTRRIIFISVLKDSGGGIDEKSELFIRGVGTHTGFGILTVRAILEIAGITIEENGTPGLGVRFEMHIPSGNYRISRQQG